MSDKIVKNFKYVGLVTPIELHDVEMMNFYNELHPVIDVKKVADNTFQALSTQENKFTGDQFLFIRAYLKIPENKLAELLHISAQDVKTWENLADQTINMDSKIESALKQHMQNHILISNKNEKSPNELLASKGMFSSSKKRPAEPDSDKNQAQQTPGIKKKKN